MHETTYTDIADFLRNTFFTNNQQETYARLIPSESQNPFIEAPPKNGPGGIQASDLEARCQNCLVVQGAAKPPFVSP